MSPNLPLLVNPGTLLVAKERLLRGGSSVCRNINLQNMFLCMGMVEKTGSGVDTILKGWLEECLMPPQVNEEHYPAQVVWELPFIGMIPQAEADKLKAQVGPQRFKGLSLPKQQILLVVYAKKSASHQDIRELLPMIHPSDLTKWLGELEAVGCLESEGKTRAKVYSLPAREMAHLGGEMAHLGGEMAHFGGEMAHLPESVQKVRNSVRISQEELERAILDLCRKEWIISSEIANILERKKRTLLHVLRPMVSHGLLEARYPAQLNHPQQAYRTISR